MDGPAARVAESEAGTERINVAAAKIELTGADWKKVEELASSKRG